MASGRKEEAEWRPPLKKMRFFLLKFPGRKHSRGNEGIKLLLVCSEGASMII